MSPPVTLAARSVNDRRSAACTAPSSAGEGLADPRQRDGAGRAQMLGEEAETQLLKHPPDRDEPLRARGRQREGAPSIQLESRRLLDLREPDAVAAGRVSEFADAVSDAGQVDGRPPQLRDAGEPDEAGMRDRVEP